jgi:hypothetical protein
MKLDAESAMGDGIWPGPERLPMNPHPGLLICLNRRFGSVRGRAPQNPCVRQIRTIDSEIDALQGV